MARTRLSCGVSTALKSTFLCSPSKAVIGLRTLFIIRDLSDVLPIDAEGSGGEEAAKGNIEGRGGGEDDGGDEGRDDGWSVGGGRGRDGGGGEGGIGGNRRGGAEPPTSG